MPSTQKHLSQVAENEAFLASAFSPSDQPRWRVVVSFYVAVHLLDAFLARVSCPDPRDHSQRFDMLRCLLRTKIVPPSVYDAYCEMYDASVDARYRCIPIAGARADRVETVLLAKLRTWVGP